MKVLVCGGRDFDDREFVWKTLDDLNEAWLKEFTMIIQGECPRGADKHAKEWAEARGIHCAGVKALWNKYGKGAGMRRNEAMMQLAPTLLVAFPGGPGTANMIETAETWNANDWLDNECRIVEITK